MGPPEPVETHSACLLELTVCNTRLPGHVMACGSAFWFSGNPLQLPSAVSEFPVLALFSLFTLFLEQQGQDHSSSHIPNADSARSPSYQPRSSPQKTGCGLLMITRNRFCLSSRTEPEVSCVVDKVFWLDICHLPLQTHCFLCSATLEDSCSDGPPPLWQQETLAGGGRPVEK